MKIFSCFILTILVLSCSSKQESQVEKNIVIAHRGAWKTQGLPENSIASLKEAIKLGCYGSEFDVHLTKDDVMVVNHDRDFMGMNIETSTYKELLIKELSNGEKIPTLKAYLEEGLKQVETKLILEIKKSLTSKKKTLKLTEMAVNLVHELKGQAMVEYICFDYDAGQLVRKLDSSAPIAYLNGDKIPRLTKNVGYTGIDYKIDIYRANPEWIQEAHDEDMTINVWTVNTEEDMKEMLDKKVDFITTNEPEKLLKMLKEEHNESDH